MTVERDVGRDMLRWYPAAWRKRYGEELVALMTDRFGGQRLPVSARFEVARAALRERARASGLAGDAQPQGVQVRAGALLVLWCWAVFVVGGAIFQKVSEHFRQAVPSGSRTVPVVAFDVVAATAVIGIALVIAGAGVTVPVFLRFLRAGGWPSVRNRIVWALASTVVTVAVLSAVVPSAHSLSVRARNGGSPPYTIAFVVMALLSAVTLALWTAAATRCARQVELSPRVLRVEGWLAVGLWLLMTLMAAATATWWGSVGSTAPWFLQGSPPGAAASAFDAKLAVAMTLMTGAVAFSSYGANRVLRHWSATP